jgi:tRNA U54 and U55 pseudouridine synthase Pus10
MEKHYHIYSNNTCVHFNLTEDEFNEIWNSLETYVKEQYTYEEVLHPRDVWAGVY